MHRSLHPLLILISFTLLKCGYTLQQAQKLPFAARLIYVVQARDETYDMGASALVTESLRKQLQASGLAQQVPLKSAQVVLEPSVKFISDALTPDLRALSAANGAAIRTPTVTRYVLSMGGTLRAVDASGKVIWQSRTVSTEEYYLAGVGGDSQLAKEQALPQTENNRRRALNHAAQVLSNMLYAQLVEDF